MDLAAIAAILALILALVVPAFLLLRSERQAKQKKADANTEEDQRLDAIAAKKAAKAERGVGKKKKGGLARMQKAQERGEMLHEEEDQEDDADADQDIGGNRKDQRKAEKRAGKAEERGARDAQREAIKEREAEKEAARQQRDAARETKEREAAEAAQKAKEEEEKRKQEEYDQWKGMFAVEEGGEEMNTEQEDQGLLKSFVTFIKEQKVTELEGLAGEFGLKVHDVINRLQGLEQLGYISGVIDDRGKFIYISREEMESVAQFIRKKGRVRISTLAQESNRLIDLTPRKLDELDEDTEASNVGESA